MLKQRELTALKHFRKDARKAFTQISRDTGIPTTTVFDYYNKLIGNVITKQVSLLDFKLLGYKSHYYIVECYSPNSLTDFLLNDNRVNCLFEVEGSKVLFEAIFSDSKEKEDFHKEVQEFRVKEVKEIEVLQELKREGVVP